MRNVHPRSKIKGSTAPCILVQSERTPRTVEVALDRFAQSALEARLGHGHEHPNARVPAQTPYVKEGRSLGAGVAFRSDCHVHAPSPRSAAGSGWHSALSPRAAGSLYRPPRAVER